MSDPHREQLRSLREALEVLVMRIPGKTSRWLVLDNDDGRSTRMQLLTAALIFVLTTNVLVHSVWVASSLGGLKDLDSFLHSGAAYASGLNPYHYYAWLRPEPISAEALNLNPPISVYLFEPLSGMDRGLLESAFLAASVMMVGASVVLLMRAYPSKRSWLVLLVVASMAGIWQMLWYLQIYAPLLLAMTGSWLMLRRGNWLLAGVLLGLVVAIKPNYAIVMAVLFAAGHFRPAIVASVTAGLVSLIPLLVDGPGIYRQWFEMTNSFAGYEWTSNASLVSVGDRLDVDPAGMLAAGGLTIGVLVFAKQRRLQRLDAMALGILTVILVGPVSWAGYTLLLLPYLFSIRWDRWTWASIAILVTPFSPERAFHALAIGLPVSVSLPVNGDVGVPGVLAALTGAVFVPLVGAIYAGAVLLLLVRLVQRLSVSKTEPSLTYVALQPTRRPAGHAGVTPEPKRHYLPQEAAR